jgi:hypothetical protein
MKLRGPGGVEGEVEAGVEGEVEAGVEGEAERGHRCL